MKCLKSVGYFKNKGININLYYQLYWLYEMLFLLVHVSHVSQFLDKVILSNVDGLFEKQTYYLKV